MLGLGERDSAFLARFASVFRFVFVCLSSAGSEDLIGSAKDLLCALFGNCIGVANRGTEPILDIASAIVGAFEVERFAAQQSD